MKMYAKMLHVTSKRWPDSLYGYIKRGKTTWHRRDHYTDNPAEADYTVVVSPNETVEHLEYLADLFPETHPEFHAKVVCWEVKWEKVLDS